MAGMEATWWLNDHLQAWLGETNAADALTLSVPHNVTSEMGLALVDVADVIRPHPEVVAFLHDVEDEGFLAELPALAGGREARAAITTYLDTYGMRCVGEIDITRPRWSERPTTLLPAILGNVTNLDAGAAARRFEQGRQEAATKEREVLERVRRPTVWSTTASDHRSSDRGRWSDDPWRGGRSGVLRAGGRRVEHATQLIRDGQRIRVDGTAGCVELLAAR